jgi:hypothetical protein
VEKSCVYLWDFQKGTSSFHREMEKGPLWKKARSHKSEVRLEVISTVMVILGYVMIYD